MGQRTKSAADMKGGVEELDLEKAVLLLLEECRMVLPGIQALFGFQLVAVFSQRFGQLSPGAQRLHLLSLSLVAAAIVLIMTPAAYHRQTDPRQARGDFIDLSTRLLLVEHGPAEPGDLPRLLRRGAGHRPRFVGFRTRRSAPDARRRLLVGPASLARARDDRCGTIAVTQRSSAPASARFLNPRARRVRPRESKRRPSWIGMKTTSRKVRALRVINQATTRSRIGKARPRQTATREAPDPGTPVVGVGTFPLSATKGSRSPRIRRTSPARNTTTRIGTTSNSAVGPPRTGAQSRGSPAPFVPSRSGTQKKVVHEKKASAERLEGCPAELVA